MINFRYHLVSLTAIFLALGLGLAMGASLVGQPLVNQLEEQLAGVGRRADDVAATNDHLERQLGSWDSFAEQAGDRLVEGRLTDVRVVMVSFAGVNGDVIGRIEASLRAAGASVPAEVMFTSRFALGDEEATAELAALVGAGSTEPSEVQAEAARRVAEAWAGRTRPEMIPDLVAADFLEITGEPGAGAPVIAELGARFLVISSRDSDLGNDSVAVPLVAAMGELSLPVVAADASRGDTDPRPESEERDDVVPFAGPLREEEQIRGRVSTVDHAAGFRGRTAIVLALAELSEAQVGQYGTGPGAERLLPD